MNAPPESATLLERYRALRDARAHPMERREAYNAWFRQRCLEGQSPSALNIHSADEVERFWAQTVPGPDGHVYWTGPRMFLRNDGKKSRPQRWTWARAGHLLTPYTEIEVTCGEAHCVTLDHMRVRPRSERRIRFADDRAFGAMQVLAMRLGRCPAPADWKTAGLPVTFQAMVLRFGSWENFCAKAGLEWTQHPLRTTDAACEAGIRALAQKLGKPPSRRQFMAHAEWLRERGYPTSPTTIKDRLGGTFATIVARVLDEQKAA